MEKFTPLAKILHCRRHWRHGQIPPLSLVWSHGVAQVLLHIVGYDMGMTQRTNEVRIKELVRKNIEIQSGYRDPEKCSVYARC